MMDIDFYNAASAKKLGWEPSWFGAEDFDDELAKAIEDFQRHVGIAADGMCGPTTFRRKFAEREADIDEYVYPHITRRGGNSIIYNGNAFPINWHKVVLWSEDGGLKASDGTFRNMAGKPPRDIRMFVNHWDVCLNSKSCHSVLEKRGISVHFAIDNGGTIYQMCDMQHVAFHAGSRKWNDWTVGVEISNAYYPKYNRWYRKHGFGERKIVSDAYVNGNRLEQHLDFYPTQIGALKALWEAVHNACGVPMACPMQGTEMLEKTSPEVAGGYFRGIIHHYHLTSRKIDCGGLNIAKHLEDM